MSDRIHITETRVIDQETGSTVAYLTPTADGRVVIQAIDGHAIATTVDDVQEIALAVSGAHRRTRPVKAAPLVAIDGTATTHLAYRPEVTHCNRPTTGMQVRPNPGNVHRETRCRACSGWTRDIEPGVWS